MKFLEADCDRIAVENPTPSKCFHIPKSTQVIEPYQFGDPYKKRTLLWLKGLPPLFPTEIVEPVGSWVQGNGEAWKRKKARGEPVTGDHKDPKIRSKTFAGIAKAMAEQWGALEGKEGSKMTTKEALKLFKDHEYMTGFSWQDEMSEVAIEALEKQIPKRPKGTYDYHGKYVVGGISKCPVCKGVLDRKMAYCDLCGQAVDWSDTSEK